MRNARSNMRLGVAVIGTAAVATTLAAAPASPAPADDVDRATAVRQTEEQAELADLTAVAESKGWTVAQAREDRRKADMLGQLQSDLVADHADVFAGAWLSPDPDGNPTLVFTGEVPADAQSRIRQSGLNPTIQTDASHTIVDLKDLASQTTSDLANRGHRSASVGVDVRANGLNIKAERRGNSENADRVRQELPARARAAARAVEVVDEQVVNLAHTRGGAWVTDDGANECTSGWSVQHSDGRQGVSTAAHCEGINGYREPGVGVYSAPWAGEHIGAFGDLEWHTTSHVELAEFYASSSVIRNVTALEGAWSISTGESICVYGRARNVRDCSPDVADPWHSTTFMWNGQQVQADGLVLMDRWAVIGGDSGGGWSWGNRAYGLTHGFENSTNRAIFSRAAYLDEALGVSVMMK